MSAKEFGATFETIVEKRYNHHFDYALQVRKLSTEQLKNLFKAYAQLVAKQLCMLGSSLTF